jgi:hypothetical protein
MHSLDFNHTASNQGREEGVLALLGRQHPQVALGRVKLHVALEGLATGAAVDAQPHHHGRGHDTEERGGPVLWHLQRAAAFLLDNVILN